jgi:hypothetical protein
MPITYTTGTINQPDAGSVGLAMVERIRDDVAASVAWDLVDEFTVASGTVRWYVLRCLAAQSGLPADFHVVIGRTLSTGELRFAICEGYTPASHQMQYFCPSSYSTGTVFDASGRVATTLILGTAPFGGGLGQPDFKSWIPSGTSTKWWITVDNDGFTVAFNGPSNGWVHAGAYTPLTALPIDLPIQLSGNKGGQSDSWGNIVRNPGAANLTVVASALIQFGLSGTSGPDTTTILGFAGDLRYNDKIQGGQRPVSEVGMMIYNYATGDQAIYGRVLGKQKRVRAGSQVPAGIAFGDAYVLSGRLWVPYLPTDVRMWDTGVASS